VASALKELFLSEFRGEHGSFIEDLGLDLHTEALTAWEGSQQLLEADFDYLLPDWREMDVDRLKSVTYSDDEVYDRLMAYVEIGNYGKSVRFWGC
jgi:hypothetical protein